MRIAIVSPVGTSLFGRAFGAEAERAREMLRSGFDSTRKDITGWATTGLPNLQASRESWAEKARRLMECLAQYSNEGRPEKSCAEVKSVSSLQRHKNGDDVGALYLLSTDTPDCLLCAGALRSFLGDSLRLNPIVRVVEELDYSSPAKFERSGVHKLLTHLSLAIGELRRMGFEPFLNGTPGFKAETALTLLLAQFLGVSTFYIHEMMEGTGVFLPSLPLTVTPEYWQKWGDLVLVLGQLSKEPAGVGVMDEKKFWALVGWKERYFHEARILFETFDEVVTLSALGDILFEFYQQKAEARLPSSTVALEEKLRLKENELPHAPQGTVEQAHKLAALWFVNYVSNFSFANSSESRVIDRFSEQEPGLVIYQHSDGNKAVKFRVETTAYNLDGWRMACQRIHAAVLKDLKITQAVGELLDSASGKGVLESYMSFEKLARERAALNGKLVALNDETDARIRSIHERLQRRLDSLKGDLAEKQTLADGRKVQLDAAQEENKALRKEIDQLKAKLSTSTSAPSSDSNTAAN